MMNEHMIIYPLLVNEIEAIAREKNVLQNGAIQFLIEQIKKNEEPEKILGALAGKFPDEEDLDVLAVYLAFAMTMFSNIRQTAINILNNISTLH